MHFGLIFIVAGAGKYTVGQMQEEQYSTKTGVGVHAHEAPMVLFNLDIFTLKNVKSRMSKIASISSRVTEIKTRSRQFLTRKNIQVK